MLNTVDDAALVSGYVPCYNNAATLRQAVESLFAQSRAVAEVIVVDDGSTDGSAESLRGLNVRLLRHPTNLGRGAARARAMQEARHPFVLSCDATNVLDPRFLELALPSFADAGVAAVFGRITQRRAKTVADRWRGRHLFKIHLPQERRGGASLSTGGALIRADASGAAGGYDARLSHTEDGDLGARLLKAGFDVVYDPQLIVISIASNTSREVLERHWRWYAGTEPVADWRAYKRAIAYSIKCMAISDLRAGDPLSIPLSLFCPHYQFWRTFWRS